jgi:hypothetical protein
MTVSCRRSAWDIGSTTTEEDCTVTADWDCPHSGQNLADGGTFALQDGQDDSNKDPQFMQNFALSGFLLRQLGQTIPTTTPIPKKRLHSTLFEP